MMGVLILAATILLTLGLAAVAVLLGLFRKASWIKYIAGFWLVWIGVYAIALFGVSVSSTEKTLAVGHPKRFCGFYLDCHMAASVKSFAKQKEYKGKTAEGMFYIVNVEISSDARRAQLRLIRPEFRFIDNEAVHYRPVAELSKPTEYFERRIGPEEAFSGEVVFDLPAKALKPKFDIRMSDPVDVAFESVIIGDEDSFFHKRKYFDPGTPEVKYGI